MFYDAAYRASPNATGRMSCGRLLISPHPVAAHHSTSSSATLNSRPHRYSRGSPRPEVRGLRHSRGHLSRGAVSAKPSLTGREWSEQMTVQRMSNLVDSGNPNSMRRPETDRRLLEVAATSFVVLFCVVGMALLGASAVEGLAKGQRPA